MNSLLFLATLVLLVLLNPIVKELRSWLSEASRVCDLGSISGTFSTTCWLFKVILLGEFCSAEFYKINFDEMINNAKRNETNNISNLTQCRVNTQKWMKMKMKNKKQGFWDAAQQYWAEQAPYPCSFWKFIYVGAQKVLKIWAKNFGNVQK